MALGLLVLGLALGMYILYFLCRFHLRLVVNANPVSSGIWALKSCEYCIVFSKVPTTCNYDVLHACGHDLFKLKLIFNCFDMPFCDVTLFGVLT